MIYTDGASSGNPGPSGCGFLIYRGSKLLYSDKIYIGFATNNVAEYNAILFAVRKAKEFHPKKILIKTDSELIARQFSGIYKVRDENLRKIYLEILEEVKGIEFNVEHIRREQNKLADKLSKEAVTMGANSNGSSDIITK
ncbi:MAG: ribonuclease H [Calditerrivibrio nitroreducens]|uniref:Ribonuclease H n=1 Tax=Calditerrivibrio nitroreducens TaxID=477976 RepID=A0A2J6WIU8_9BACT|nr:MAG: ribonuclease H [Calditerrivibrio nitroreducens]